MANVGNVNILDPIDCGHPLARGLVGCWIAPGAKAGGNKLYDLSPYHNHGPLEASMTRSDWVPAQHGRGFGLDFDGNDDYVELDDNIFDFMVTGPFTVSAWFNVSLSGKSAILSVRADADTVPLQYDADGNAKLRFHVFDGANSRRVYSNSTVDDGNWHFGVALLTEQNGIQELFLDGMSQGTNAGVSVAAKAWYNEIGGEYQLVSQSFPGFISEIMVWSCALSAAEIRQLYIAGLTGDYPFLRSRMPYELWPRAAGYAPPPHIFQPIGALS